MAFSISGVSRRHAERLELLLKQGRYFIRTCTVKRSETRNCPSRLSRLLYRRCQRGREPVPQVNGQGGFFDPIQAFKAGRLSPEGYARPFRRSRAAPSTPPRVERTRNRKNITINPMTMTTASP